MKTVSESAVMEYLKANPLKSDRTVYRRTGASYTLIKRLRQQIGAIPQAPTPKRSGFSRSEFAAQFDHDTRLRRLIAVGVKTLKSRDEILEDATFRQARCANTGTGGWRQIAAEAEFRPFQFTVKGQVFWAHPETVQWAINTIQGAATL